MTSENLLKVDFISASWRNKPLRMFLSLVTNSQSNPGCCCVIQLDRSWISEEDVVMLSWLVFLERLPCCEDLRPGVLARSCPSRLAIFFLLRSYNCFKSFYLYQYFLHSCIKSIHWTRIIICKTGIIPSRC